LLYGNTASGKRVQAGADFFDGELGLEAPAPLTAPESPQGKGPALPERGGDQGEPPQPVAVPALARGLAGRAGNGALKKIKS